jgi:hypothetical protein
MDLMAGRVGVGNYFNLSPAMAISRWVDPAWCRLRGLDQERM